MTEAPGSTAVGVLLSGGGRTLQNLIDRVRAGSLDLDIRCVISDRDGAYGLSKGSTRVTVRFSMLGTQDAKLLWESSSDGIRQTATTMDTAPPVIESVNLAVDKICENLPFQ